LRFRLVHHLYVRRSAVEQFEPLFGSRVFGEAVGPVRVEVDGVREDETRQVVERTLWQKVLDTPLGLPLHPFVYFDARSFRIVSVVHLVHSSAAPLFER